MNDLSEAFIDECLKYHSDYDSESDSSSECRSELDDEYYQIIEKPIPVDELIRNTINSFDFEQCDSNLASCPPDNSSVAVTNKNSRYYVDYRHFGYEDEAKEKTNDVVEQDSFCEVRKKRRRQKTCKKKFQTTSNRPCDNNMYNCLLNKEDIDTEEEKEEINNENDLIQITSEICVEQQPNHNETEMGRKKESGKTHDKTSKKRRKKNKKIKDKKLDLNNSTAVINSSNSYKAIDHNPIEAVRRQTLDSVSDSQKSSDFGASSDSIYRSCKPSRRCYTPSSAIPLTGFMPCKSAFELGYLLLSYTRQFSGDCYQDNRSVVLGDIANVPTTKICTRTNNNSKHTTSWIVHKKALLTPETDITEDTSLSCNENRKRLSKNINSSDVKNATLRDIKKGKKQIYHDDNNLHSWRATPSIIQSLSSINWCLNKYETKQNSPNGAEQLQKNILTLPINHQTKIFPILHQIPRIMATEDERIQSLFEKRYTEYSQVLLSPFIPNVQMMDREELVQTIKNVFRNDFVFSLILSGLEMFGLNIQQNLFGVTLKFEVCRLGVWINVETTDNLKYSTSRFRIICK